MKMPTIEDLKEDVADAQKAYEDAKAEVIEALKWQVRCQQNVELLESQLKKELTK